MAETSAIGWTDATVSGCVSGFMAGLAQRKSIADFEAQFRVICERFQVVSMKIAAAGIAAPLAGETISGENISPPSLVISGKAETSTLHQLPVLKGMTCAPSRIGFALGCAHLQPRLVAVSSTGHRARQTLLHLGEARSRFRAMRPASERTRPAARIDPLLHTIAFEAFRLGAVTPRPISSKHTQMLPRAAKSAPLQSSGAQPKILFQINARVGCGILSRANRGLRHG